MEVLGYGAVHVPAAAGAPHRHHRGAATRAARAPRAHPRCAPPPPRAGEHEVSCPVWRPVGTPAREHAAFFLGAAAAPPPAPSADALAGATDRAALRTVGAGTVHARFEVVFRGVDAYGVEW